MDIRDETTPQVGPLTSNEAGTPPKQHQQASDALAFGKRRPIVFGDNSDEPEKKRSTFSGAVGLDTPGIVTDEASHLRFGLASPPTLRHETQWRRLSLDKLGFESPDWNPVKYPLPGPTILHPPERILSYDITPRPPKEEFEKDLRDVVNNRIRDGLQEYREWDEWRPLSLTKKSRMDKVTNRAMVSVVKSNKRSGSPLIAYISLKTFEEAAFFRLKEDLKLVSRYEGYKLTLRKAGRCHPQDLTAIGITPELPDGTNVDSVDEGDYIDTAVGLLRKCPELEPVGAWQETIKWNDDQEQMCPRVVLVVKRALDFDESRIPGYGNNHGIYVDDCASVPQDATWFRFEFGKRRPYCKHCKTELHGLSVCPKVEVESVERQL